MLLATPQLVATHRPPLGIPRSLRRPTFTIRTNDPDDSIPRKGAKEGLQESIITNGYHGKEEKTATRAKEPSLGRGSKEKLSLEK